ncbi:MULTISPECIES: type VI secretion system protein IglI family protein [Sorangium]|uniref:ImpA N-terminal domain-containing protein n=1 Tax=Sorangium cellulosum TaxID=56 RepID=A0A4P2QGX9_SORCE|nr:MULTISPECIES: type VI secretion system protein IglI family protein [Sorangium]AUX29120.1 hypothetical protein SOCE836_012070 [Sorangium cellulosum]WCQ88511.1 hypothetical protein NQZ70_01189 [Sorangium sp. Soce836]
MFDTATVARALEGPGQDVAEATVEEVTRLAQAGEPRAAAEQAARAIRAGCTDVRLIAAFLLGAFDERGPAALPAMLEALASAIGRRWAALRPEARRDRAVDSALCLLFRSVKSSIDYRESQRDATWRAWSARVERDLARACADAAATLDAAISERIASPRCAMELAGLRARVDLCLQRLPPPPDPPPQPAAAPEPPEPEELDPPDAEAEPAEAAEGADDAGAQGEPPEESRPAPAASAPGARLIEVSPALERFIRKLEVFADLLERGETGKAAIVARDIKAAVDHFDPRVYLPRLLSPYFRLLSANIETIAPHWEAAETPAWQALEQLYQVDLEAFLEH